MINKEIELLAPAGNRESFISAINAGANAVYLAGKNFGARKNADNFTNVEIQEMISYAHLRNVAVYVTINTIIFEDEISEVFAFADELVMNNVDAFIVQDIGIIEAFCLRYPNTNIHASTQMNTYNLEQIKYLKEIGVNRIVLARETSLQDIKKITSSVDIDIEVFIHGALCVSYSGNCSLSYFMGGRSGNRGECAQPCRLKYKLIRDEEIVSDSSYLLSTKDLMTIEYLNEIKNCGVKSLKIEGRMKKPSYVATTVIAYKEALENIDTPNYDVNQSIHELQVSFNREHTKGYLLQEMPYNINNSNRPNHQGIEVGTVLSYQYGKTTILLTDTLSVLDGIRIEGITDIGGVVFRILKNNEKVQQAYKGDVVVLDIQSEVVKGSKVLKTLDFSQETKMGQYLDENFKLVPLFGKMTCEIGKPIEIEINSKFISVQKIVSDYIVEEAKFTKTTKKDLYNTFNTLGNTFYYLEDFKVFCDDNVFIPKGIIKELKRNALELIELNALNKKSPKIQDTNFEEIKPIISNNKINVKVETYEQFDACKLYPNIEIFVSENLKIEHPDIYQNRIIKDYQSYEKYNKVIIQDFGSINSLKNKQLYANYNMNIVNSYSLYALMKRGITQIMMSLESTFDNTKMVIQEFKKEHNTIPNIEVLMYGRNDNMISQYCPITKSEGVNRLNCNLCINHDYALKDDNDRTFPLIRDTECNIRVLNHTPINRIDQMDNYTKIGVSQFRFEFTNESAKDVINILEKASKYTNRKIHN